MAEYNLLNNVSTVGTYDQKSLALDSVPTATLMIDEITITKEADREIWATGLLTYTITITNNSSHPYTDVELTDILDTTITLVDGSVTINGRPAVIDIDYTFAAGKLTVTIPEVPQTTGETIVMFQVSKV